MLLGVSCGRHHAPELYYARRRQQRRKVDGGLVAGLVRRERQRRGYWARASSTTCWAEFEGGVRIGRDRMFEELRKHDLLLEPVPAQY